MKGNRHNHTAACILYVNINLPHMRIIQEIQIMNAWLLNFTDALFKEFMPFSLVGLVHLLDSLSSDELVNCFADRSSLLSQFVSQVNSRIHTIEEHTLEEIANLVNPSNTPYVRLHLLENRDTKG